MTKMSILEDVSNVRLVLKMSGGWMSTPDIRNKMSPISQKRANVQNCLSKLMLRDQAERKHANVNTAAGKYVYRYRSGVVVHDVS